MVSCRRGHRRRTDRGPRRPLRAWWVRQLRSSRCLSSSTRARSWDGSGGRTGALVAGRLKTSNVKRAHLPPCHYSRSITHTSCSTLYLLPTSTTPPPPPLPPPPPGRRKSPPASSSSSSSRASASSQRSASPVSVSRSLASALASIWRTRVCEMPIASATAPSVSDAPLSPRPKRSRTTAASRGVRRSSRYSSTSSRRIRAETSAAGLSAGDLTLSSRRRPSDPRTRASREAPGAACLPRVCSATTACRVRPSRSANSTSDGARPSSACSARAPSCSAASRLGKSSGRRSAPRCAAREARTACRIHQTAYVEKRWPRSGSKRSAARMRPSTPSWTTSCSCTCGDRRAA
eukprot:scaffold121447_cov64-Phaeocystis_antarctica.AAC.2